MPWVIPKMEGNPTIYTTFPSGREELTPSYPSQAAIPKNSTEEAADRKFRLTINSSPSSDGLYGHYPEGCVG